MGGTGAEVSRSISIHALREERDYTPGRVFFSPIIFQSTRSARSATFTLLADTHRTQISIHALREERDAFSDPHHKGKDISIHALREERDYAELIRKGLKTIISIHALREERDPVLTKNHPF